MIQPSVAGWLSQEAVRAKVDFVLQGLMDVEEWLNSDEEDIPPLLIATSPPPPIDSYHMSIMFYSQGM